ncbi:hypothetical protein Tco_0377616 [Tanacetum coccineum]
MVLMVELNCGEHLIRRFAERGNEPDPHDDSSSEEAETESNAWDDGPEDVNLFGGGNPGDEEEEYPFVNKYPSFQKEPIVLVEEESCPVYDTDNEEEELMPIYDTDIKDVIEEEEGFFGKGGFGEEEDNIEDVVVVANDLCSSMIQTSLSVDFEEDISTKSDELMSFEISIIIKGKENGVNILKSIDEEPFQLGTFRETLAEGTECALHFGLERPRVYSDLTLDEKQRYNADIRATNILLQGLPKDIYSLINHYTDAKDIWDNIWDNIKMLLEGSELIKEDRGS